MHVKLGDGRWLARCLLWGLLVVGPMQPYALRAGQWEFIKIADPDTVVPGFGRLTGYEDVILHDGIVTFRALGGVSGTLWQYDQGTFVPLIKPGVVFPGTDQPFYRFDYTWAGDELWLGGNVANGPTGLFRWDQGQFVSLIPGDLRDPLTQLPFQYVQPPIVQVPDADGRIVFTGQYNQNSSAIYRYSPATGGLETILDRNTLVPGRSVAFNWINRPVQLGDRVLFAGGNFQDQTAGGLYEWRDGQIVELAPEAPVLPPPPGYETKFVPTRADYGYLGTDPLFTGEDERGGPRTLFLHTETPTPLASQCADPAACVDEWRYLYDLAIDTDREAFVTSSGGTLELQRLSYFADGVQETVLDGEQILYGLGPSFGVVPPQGDELLGTGVGARIGLQSVENGTIAFTAVVENRDLLLYRNGLFIAVRVPEPQAGVLAAMAVATILGVALPRLSGRRIPKLNSIAIEGPPTSLRIR